LCGFGFPGFF